MHNWKIITELHIHQKCIFPVNYSYSNATWYQKRKAVVIADSHLNRINKSIFKNDNISMRYTLSALVVQTQSNWIITQILH